MNIKFKIFSLLLCFFTLNVGIAKSSFAQHDQIDQTAVSGEINLYSAIKQIPNSLENIRNVISGNIGGEVVVSGSFSNLSDKSTIAVVKSLTVLTLRLSIITLSISMEILKAFLGLLVRT